MYEKHFSFKHKPFELVPNPDFLFPSSTHEKAKTYLRYGIKEKIGFVLLTGEIGSGKTTIIRNIIKNLDGSVKLSRVNNTMVTSEQLISMINEDFGLDTEGKSKPRLLSELSEFLIEQYAKKIQTILLIDEAQNLSPELLEEVRLLSNLETDKAKLLQIILVGQPELGKTLMLPQLTQLRQRININYHIAPLSIDETAKYIEHRLTVAGNPDAIKLQDDMSDIIYQFSKGIPRLINILCDFALLSSYVEGKKEVSVDIFREVTRDLESHDYWSETEETAVSETDRNNQDHDLSKAFGDIARRIIKVEEVIENNIPEIASLSEKVKELEKELIKINKDEEDNRIDNLLERVNKLENMQSATNGEKIYSGFEIDEEKPLEEHVELLKKILNRVNNKLKKSYELEMR
jgi:putative secretion ATPase (PEP-CTERM system associated)